MGIEAKNDFLHKQIPNLSLIPEKKSLLDFS